MIITANNCENAGSEDDYGTVAQKGTKYLRSFSGTYFWIQFNWNL